MTSRFANKPTEHKPCAEPGRYQAAMRKCLRCTLPFKSEWVGNRLCQKCKDHAARVRIGTPQWSDHYV